MLKWFTSKKAKPVAMAFVDYEHWYISLERFYRMKPDIKSWRQELMNEYELREISFFADFSHEGIAREVGKIREVTNLIIETRNTSPGFKKDFTDFIMLDQIYQKAITEKDVDTFIIFSGDGHFSSVTSFIQNHCKKKAVVYGITGAFSKQLKNASTRYREIPGEGVFFNGYHEMLLKNFCFIEERAAHTIRPTFRKTIEAVAKYNRVPQQPVRAALQELVDKGYVIQELCEIAPGNTITVIRPLWEKLSHDGLWTNQPSQVSQ